MDRFAIDLGLKKIAPRSGPRIRKDALNRWLEIDYLFPRSYKGEHGVPHVPKPDDVLSNAQHEALI